MKLCLIRHGNALNHDIDALRTLSSIGRDEARSAGKFLRESSFHPQKIFHSELIRAKETATLVAQELSFEGSLIEDPHLLPSSPIKTWSDNIHFMDEDIILVGHMPYMGIFATDLYQRDLVLPTGGVVLFEIKESVPTLVMKNF